MVLTAQVPDETILEFKSQMVIWGLEDFLEYYVLYVTFPHTGPQLESRINNQV